MKILVISDITLEPFKRVVNLKFPELQIDLIYSDNLALQLFSTEIPKEIDLIYIHFDSFFKKYEENYLNTLIKSIYTFASKTNKSIISSNCIIESFKAKPISNSFGLIADSSLSFIEARRKINIDASNLCFYDFLNLVLNLGIKNIYNFRLGHLYQMPYNKYFLDFFAENWVKLVQKSILPDKKVIVLDCDYTLWNGIISEDGLDGIKCDLNEEGILYYHFQQYLIQKKSEGFLLTLCSKNNENEVKNAFSVKKMPLKWTDFIVKKINWKDKKNNIQEIAKELNLGLDSFIFIDDSDFEVNSIKVLLPQVYTIKMDTDYNNLNSIFQDYTLMKKVISNEDLNKSEQYYQESIRNQIKETDISFNEYIKSLEINIQMDVNSLNDLQRIAQLTEKTNQFNFNKKSYEVFELQELIKSSKMKIFSLKVNDKFGDYGLVGVLLVTYYDNFPVLENYIISCRALGRRIEFDFFNLVEENLFEKHGHKFKKIRFQKTEKNLPAQKFYEEITNNYGN
jgi:FkbH-like protein